LGEELSLFGHRKTNSTFQDCSHLKKEKKIFLSSFTFSSFMFFLRSDSVQNFSGSMMGEVTWQFSTGDALAVMGQMGSVFTENL
jgi:hypothetical protein